ncbi:MAG: hypothetical protein MZV64_44885 [Ignavibacteriales bacterium]|nr:hypothetical protein [Ignavibacteriales bacterium]
MIQRCAGRRRDARAVRRVPDAGLPPRAPHGAAADGGRRRLPDRHALAAGVRSCTTSRRRPATTSGS